MKYEGITIIGIAKTVEKYMRKSCRGGLIIYNTENGRIEYIDAFYDSAIYYMYESYYADGSSYWDAHPELIVLDNNVLADEEQKAIWEANRSLKRADISKIIKNQIVKQVKAI